MKTILYCLLLILCSCTTLKKNKSSEQSKSDTQEATSVEQQAQTKSIAFDGSKINLVYNHATPNANLFTYNVTTGNISANGIVGVNVETKRIIEKQTINFLRYVNRKEVVTIHEKETVYKSKGLPWYVKALLFFGSISIIILLVQLYFWIRKTFYLPTPVI